MNHSIPTQLDNPTGHHLRYQVMKIVPMTKEELDTFKEKQGHEPLTRYKLEPPHPSSEYFVLRLDTGGSDLEHIKACRKAINTYADAIEHHLPDLAKDIRKRYPLL